MTITLPPELESRLKAEAERRGVDANAYAAQLVVNGLRSADQTDVTLALLDEWDQEEETQDPAEIQRQQAEAEEFMRSLAQSRAEMEGPDARKIWP